MDKIKKSKQKPTIDGLLNTIGKLKAEHQRVVFKLNKINEKSHADLLAAKQAIVEHQITIETLKQENRILKLRLDQPKCINNIKCEAKKKLDESVLEKKSEYEVESILEERMRRRQKQYLVRRKGFGADHDSWEPKKNLQCPEVLKTYEDSKQNKTNN